LQIQKGWQTAFSIAQKRIFRFLRVKMAKMIFRCIDSCATVKIKYIEYARLFAHRNMAKKGKENPLSSMLHNRNFCAFWKAGRFLVIF